MEPRGLEPLTLCLQSRCATNCAKAPYDPRVAVVSGLQNRVGCFLPQSLLVLAGIDTLLGHDSGCNRDAQEKNLLHN